VASGVKLAYSATNSSWLNRIKVRFNHPALLGSTAPPMHPSGSCAPSVMVSMRLCSVPSLGVPVYVCGGAMETAGDHALVRGDRQVGPPTGSSLSARLDPLSMSDKRAAGENTQNRPVCTITQTKAVN
jgi:hypothetical protein